MELPADVRKEYMSEDKEELESYRPRRVTGAIYAQGFEVNGYNQQLMKSGRAVFDGCVYTFWERSIWRFEEVVFIQCAVNGVDIGASGFDLKNWNIIFLQLTKYQTLCSVCAVNYVRTPLTPFISFEE